MAMRSASRAKIISVVPALGGRGAAGLAFLARAVDLHDALLAGEFSRRGDFFDQRLDVGAEKLERLIAGLADEVKVARMAVRVLETEAAFAEIDLAGDPRIHHPLQRAIDRGAADAAIFLADEIDEVVGAEVPLLAEERIDDEVAFAGALAARRAHAFDINGSHALQVNSEMGRGTAREPLP